MAFSFRGVGEIDELDRFPFEEPVREVRPVQPVRSVQPVRQVQQVRPRHSTAGYGDDDGQDQLRRRFLGDDNLFTIARQAFHTRPNQFLDVPFAQYKDVVFRAMSDWYAEHGRRKTSEYRGSEVILGDQLVAGMNSDFMFDHSHLFESNDKFGTRIKLKADYGSGQCARYARMGEVLTPDDYERLDLFRSEDTVSARQVFKVNRDSSEQYRGITTRRYDRSGEGFSIEQERSSLIMPLRRLDNTKFVSVYEQQMRKYELERDKPKPLYHERVFTRI